MNFTNLHYFVTVAEELNISRAAQKLFTSPQALSEQIRRMESIYDIKFFQRTPRLQLTYAGERFLRFARHVLEQEKELAIELDEISSHKRGKLSVGFTVFLQRAIVPNLLPRFHRENPYVELDIQTGQSKPLVHKLLEGHLDLSICNFSGDLPPGIKVDQTFHNRFCIAIPKCFLLKRGMPTDAERLTHADLYTLLQEEPLLTNISGTQSRHLTDLYLDSLGLSAAPLIQLNEMNSLLHLCAEGMGITFTFEVTGTISLAVKDLQSQVVLVPLRDYDDRSKVYVLHNADRYLTWTARRFLDLLSTCDLSLSPVSLSLHRSWKAKHRWPK